MRLCLCCHYTNILDLKVEPYGAWACAYFVSLQTSFWVHKIECFSFLSISFSSLWVSIYFFIVFIYSLFITVFAVSLFVSFFYCRFFCVWLEILFTALSQCIFSVSTRLVNVLIICFSLKFMFFFSQFLTTDDSKYCVSNKRRFKIKFVARCYFWKDNLALSSAIWVIYFICISAMLLGMKTFQNTHA